MKHTLKNKKFIPKLVSFNDFFSGFVAQKTHDLTPKKLSNHYDTNNFINIYVIILDDLTGYVFSRNLNIAWAWVHRNSHIFVIIIIGLGQSWGCFGLVLYARIRQFSYLKVWSKSIHNSQRYSTAQHLHWWKKFITLWFDKFFASIQDLRNKARKNSSNDSSF